MYMLALLYLVGIAHSDTCTFHEKKVSTENSGPARLEEENEVKYTCLPTHDQDDTVILMEFEQVEGDSSRLVIEPWIIDHFRFACQRDSGEWYTTSKDGHRQYLKKVWCNGFKKSTQRKAVIDELRKKIAKKHTEL